MYFFFNEDPHVRENGLLTQVEAPRYGEFCGTPCGRLLGFLRDGPAPDRSKVSTPARSSGNWGIPTNRSTT